MQKFLTVQSKLNQKFNNTGNYLGVVLLLGMFVWLVTRCVRKNHLKISGFNTLNDVREHHRILYRHDGAIYR
jgi:hypothetical protein